MKIEKRKKDIYNNSQLIATVHIKRVRPVVVGTLNKPCVTDSLGPTLWSDHEAGGENKVFGFDEFIKIAGVWFLMRG